MQIVKKTQKKCQLEIEMAGNLKSVSGKKTVFNKHTNKLCQLMVFLSKKENVQR
jgi:hypothetical protein